MKEENISVEVSSTVPIGDHILYDIDITLFLDTHKIERYQISKRFSDFVDLKKHLSKNGCTTPSLPSRLSSFYKNGDTVINERKQGLVEYSRSLLLDEKLRFDIDVLNFFNIPKSTLLESSISKSDDSSQKEYSTQNIEIIQSMQQWSEVYKSAKSMLQDLRTKLFNSASTNVVEIRKLVKTIENSITNLQKYLSNDNELGTGEIRRRKELVIHLNKDFTELNELFVNMKFNSLSQTKQISEKATSSTSSSSSLFQTRSSNRRTFGKPKETSVTKQYDDLGLLQLQKKEMETQDSDLNQLREIIMRQKQIGIAVNEELTIQNELLSSLDQQVDNSTARQNFAKSKINKII